MCFVLCHLLELINSFSQPHTCENYDFLVSVTSTNECFYLAALLLFTCSKSQRSIVEHLMYTPECRFPIIEHSFECNEVRPRVAGHPDAEPVQGSAKVGNIL